MVLEEFLDPVDLSGIQTFCIHKVIKIAVIDENKYLMLETFQIVVPYLEDYDNSQKFTIVDLVSYFYRNYFL